MILFTSSSRAGSWQIRGRQLAAAVGGEAVENPTWQQLKAARLVVVVKRATPELLALIRDAGARVVLDVVDPWPQPDGNRWTGPEAATWLKSYIRSFAPLATVVTTSVMRAATPPGMPCLILPHHARPHQAINPVRRAVAAVGYEGSVRYLDGWLEPLQRHAKARGWHFYINPEHLADLDIVVAVRGGPWRGWATDNYKSNVKMANAQATGTPIILLPEQASIEAASGAEYWVETPADLPAAFDRLAPYEERLARSDVLRLAAPHLSHVAATYRSFLDGL